MAEKKGKLIIISAPSGTGKSTIIGELTKDDSLKLEFSISATTRQPRRGEQDGVNYYFMTVEQFKEAIANDEFAEYEEVYPGRYYGTLKREIERINGDGRNVILDIDVKGGVNVKRMYGDEALSIFIAPPSIATLQARLEGRATDSAEEIAKRVAKAEFELTFADKFDHRVVNDDLATAVEQTRSLIKQFIN
ncbi:MAG: guanylate kinase [Bacteroidales bacterium]|nr:guanylate kinase [Bacteroidales bacterium]MDY3912262.1 guanylate kinase [Sodaliphilus sp.]